MPVVQHPGSLTALITTPVGSVVVPVPVANRLNDLFRAWTALQTQTNYVLPRRMDKATYYRARFKQAVSL